MASPPLVRFFFSSSSSSSSSASPLSPRRSPAEPDVAIRPNDEICSFILLHCSFVLTVASFGFRSRLELDFRRRGNAATINFYGRLGYETPTRP